MRASISSEEGFIALTAILLISAGTIAISVSAMSTAASYQDLVLRSEIRIQSALNGEACGDSAVLIHAKDIFATGKFWLREFGCYADL